MLTQPVAVPFDRNDDGVMRRIHAQSGGTSRGRLLDAIAPNARRSSSTSVSVSAFVGVIPRELHRPEMLRDSPDRQTQHTLHGLYTQAARRQRDQLLQPRHRDLRVRHPPGSPGRKVPRPRAQPSDQSPAAPALATMMNAFPRSRTPRHAQRQSVHDPLECAVSPLLARSESEIWQYIRAHEVPYNALLDRQFPRIGCSPFAPASRHARSHTSQAHRAGPSHRNARRNGQSRRGGKSTAPHPGVGRQPSCVPPPLRGKVVYGCVTGDPAHTPRQFTPQAPLSSSPARCQGR